MSTTAESESVIPQKLSRLERVACTICGSGDSRLLFRKWHFSIVQCVDCGLVYVNPRGFRIEADDYFEGPYLSTIEKDGRLDANISGLYSEIADNLARRVPPGRLLDVGCAMGHFLGFAKSRGWDVEGVECSAYAARYAEERLGVKVHPVCALKEANLPPDFFHACVLVEVIEHLPDPRETLTEVWRVLQPGGIVYITTPNFACYRSLLLREEWTTVIPVGHLYYFDRASLGQLLSSIGFVNVENLTAPADFAAELASAQKSGSLKLGREELAKVTELARRDAEAGSSNGRAEGLVMCARKAWDPAHRPPAFRRRAEAFNVSFEGCLVRRPGESPEDQMVYFVENGRKRWVTSAKWIVARGMHWPADVQFVTAEELDAIPTGPLLP